MLRDSWCCDNVAGWSLLVEARTDSFADSHDYWTFYADQFSFCLDSQSRYRAVCDNPPSCSMGDNLSELHSQMVFVNMETALFSISVTVSVLLFLVSIVGSRRGWLKIQTSDGFRIAELESKIKWLTDERNQLISKVLHLERKEARLQETIAELQKKVGINPQAPRKPFVLGIWPSSNLDTKAERNAIYNAGFQYRSLAGPAVTRSSILRELRTGSVTILEVGAHGDETGIMVNGQNLSAGWWENALRDHDLEIALLLACTSISSVADAMKRAGVEHVIAVDGEIDDIAAVEFARQFYQLYADGESVEDAVSEAKLSLEPAQAERIILR